MGSYKKDIFLMIPLADNKNNWRLDEIFKQAKKNKREGYDWIKQHDEFAATLMAKLEENFQYECRNVVADELEMAYLGSYEFIHSTDDYPDANEDPECVATENCHMILTLHEPTHIYVLTIVLPNCAYDATQVLDQMSHESMWIKMPEDAKDFLTKENRSGLLQNKYLDIYKFLKYRYGLLKCGEAKAFVLLSDRPEESEFKCMMAGETYNSIHQTFHVDSENLKTICETDYAQYDYYNVYMSETVVACIMESFDDDVEGRNDLTATYAFILILVMFQNTSIVKVNMQITNALANDGDISHEQILSLYRNFGKTVRFWEKHNFKYWGTQQEALQIIKAFGNEELQESYLDHQSFLEHIVELKSARVAERNGNILSIVATILAIIQVQAFAVEMLEHFYGFVGINANYANTTFSTLIICGTISFILVMILLKYMRDKTRKGSMHIKELRDEEE